MLIAFDIGNTVINIGVFEREMLKTMLSISSNEMKTEDEYGIEIYNMMLLEKISAPEITKAIISSVMPSLTIIFEKLINKYFHVYPYIVNPYDNYGITIRYDNPLELGADRIANAVAAAHKYNTDSIIVDLGTAISFDVIREGGIYEGGIIAPGIGIASDALFKKAAKLPRVEMSVPPTVVGKNTIRSMQSGIFFGFVCMIDGLIRMIKTELNIIPRVISTGGWGEMITSKSHEIDEYNRYFTLEGLRIIAHKRE